MARKYISKDKDMNFIPCGDDDSCVFMSNAIAVCADKSFEKGILLSFTIVKFSRVNRELCSYSILYWENSGLDVRDVMENLC